MLDHVFSDDAILSCTTATQCPEEILVLDFVGDKHMSGCCYDGHLENLARCQTVGGSQWAMATALDIASQTDTGILACRHDPALTCREGENVAPLLAAADDEDVFG